MADIDWVKKVMEAKLSSQLIENTTLIIDKIGKIDNPKDIGKVITDLLAIVFSGTDSKQKAQG